MKDKLTVQVTAKEVYRKKITIRFLKIIIALVLLFLSAFYAILYIINYGGNFTINLDPNLKATKNLMLSSSSDFKTSPIILRAKSLEYMDNITESWLPADILDQEGEHSKDNYIAYTFFLKNNGEDIVNYIREIKINSVIKDVDEAVRVAVYLNREKSLYAKKAKSGSPEPGTIAFTSSHQVLYETRSNMKPGDVDRYTIIIWLEGEDPECVDDIIGGEMKMEMLIKELRETTDPNDKNIIDYPSSE